MKEKTIDPSIEFEDLGYLPIPTKGRQAEREHKFRLDN